MHDGLIDSDSTYFAKTKLARKKIDPDVVSLSDAHTQGEVTRYVVNCTKILRIDWAHVQFEHTICDSRYILHSQQFLHIDKFVAFRHKNFARKIFESSIHLSATFLSNCAP